MEISHPWHDHPLFLSDEVKLGDECSICKEGLDGNPCYACVDCEYYVHKSCAQLPVEIQHHFHPPHPLALCIGDYFACDSCHKKFRNYDLQFRCSDCDFDLDVKCALMKDIDVEGKEFIRHFTHQHPLKICSKDGDNPLNCFACKKTSSDLIYGCPPCEYFLHRSCLEISAHVLHAIHPQHALSFAVKFGTCYYCDSYDETWKYNCEFCNFRVDASCLIESTKDDQNSCFLCGKLHMDSDSCVNLLYFLNQSCIQLPEQIKVEFHSHELLLMLGAKDFWCNSCHKRFETQSHYGCEECNFRMDVICALMPSIRYEESNETIWPVIPRHFDHQHPLILISEVYDINCSACNTTKLSPIYGCIKCEYFLHQSCLELPIQIDHPFHDSHMLTLQPLHDSFCQICCRKDFGLAFGCIQCLFFIGIECIFELRLAKTIVHKYHDHTLYLIEKSYCDRCNSDNTFCRFFEKSSEFKLTKSYSLRCIKCDYNLHLLCGPLPCTIKHKSHLHALTLVDYIVEDDSDEYYCDICEEIRSPQLCVYYCEDCQFFAHVHCVLCEIINVFKKTSEKVELRIVGDLRFEDTVNPLYNNFTGELLLDLLNHMDANDMIYLKYLFPDGKFFLTKEEERWEMFEKKSSSEDDPMNIVEELSFYGDDIFEKIEERLELFKPHTKYHIQPDECELKLIEVEGYKVTSNFVSLFRNLLIKYGDFGHSSILSENAKSVMLYFLCRVLRSMHRTFIADITEKQLFTWRYYINRISNTGFDLEFVNPLIDKITRSYYGLQAMKFENKAPDRLDQAIVNLEQKISDTKTQIEKLKCHRQQHKIGRIAAESTVMREFFTAAKELKWHLAGDRIFSN